MVNKNIIFSGSGRRISSDLFSSSSAFRDISGTKIEYGIFNIGSSTLYSAFQLYELNDSLLQYVLVTKYFLIRTGNPREVVSKDGVHTVYLWSLKIVI
jgi:hypothetical protein